MVETRTISWARYNRDGSQRYVTKTHAWVPSPDPAETLCGIAIPGDEEEIGFGAGGVPSCRRCRVLEALKTTHVVSVAVAWQWHRGHQRTTYTSSCSCGWAGRAHRTRRDAEAEHREHVRAVVLDD